MNFYGACSVVVDFLYPADRVSLKWVSKALYREIKTHQILQDIRDIVIRKLSHKLKNISGELFLMKMQHHGIVMSGSFLLQCLMGEDWENSDVDLYFMATSENSSGFSEKKSLNELHIHGFSQWLIDENWETSVDTYPGLPIRSVMYAPEGSSYDDKIHGKMINMIQIYPKFNMSSQFHRQYHKFYPSLVLDKDNKYYLFFKSVTDYVEQTCDMHFLQNVFDGKNCQIGNWESIVERKSKLESFRSVYTRKSSMLSDCVKGFIHRMKSRIEKYELRGFDLTWKNEFHQHYFESHLRNCGKTNGYDSDVDEKHVCIKTRKSIEDRVELQNIKKDLKFDNVKKLSWYQSGFASIWHKRNKSKTHLKKQKKLEVRYCISVILGHSFQCAKAKWNKIVFTRVKRQKKITMKQKTWKHQRHEKRRKQDEQKLSY
jgi:hypothetical protein